MATYKVLGQANIATAATAVDLYTVPAAKSAVCSTLVACNQNATPVKIRISVRQAGAAAALQQYIVYDASISANDSGFFTLGITLATTDVVTVQSDTINVSFNLFGSEV